MTKIYTSKVIAILVTFQPDLKSLSQLLTVLVPQIDSVVIVDNGSEVDLAAWNCKHQTSAVEVILLDENRGIAAAHNIGIQWAMNNGAEFLLLMDQDSIPAIDMVQKLKFALLNAEKKFDSPAIAAGPICIDSRTGSKSFFVTERNGIPSRWWPDSSFPPFNVVREVSSLISSGTLINLKSLKKVGGMRDNYFIDHVDTEWCFRAKAKGYILLGVPNALMTHTLGDQVKNIWFFGWRNVAYHSPLRDYYMFRNTLIMCHDTKMTVLWRVHLIMRLLKFLIYFLVFTPQRVQRFYCMTLGFCHGLLGISGKLDLETGRCSNIPKSDLDL